MCISIFTGYAQNIIYEDIQQAKNYESFDAVSPFSLANSKNAHSTWIADHFINPQEVYIMHYNLSAFNKMGATVTLIVPFGIKNLQLEIQEVKIDYQITVSNGQKIMANKNLKHYQGIVKNDPNSIVAITFSENEIIGVVSTDDGNFNLAFDRQIGEHIFFNDKNLKHKPDFECSVWHDDFDEYDSEMLLNDSKSSSRGTEKTVRLYFETEYDIYTTLGSIPAVETYVSGVYNQVSALYRNESINTSLSQIMIWNTTDPYTAPEPGGLLTQFQSVKTSFNGDLGQLLTFRNIGGGVAAGFNGLCNGSISQRLSVAMVERAYSTVPTYSLTVFIVTHEFGHLFGSRHTHACVWNGTNTAIDGCAGYSEPTIPGTPGYGTCPIPGIPANGGTLMSYCNWQPVGVNFNLGFGPQPGNVIRNSVLNASCLISITGPTSISQCKTYNYYLTNISSGFTWGCSSNLTVTGTGTSVNVKGNTAGAGYLFIKNSSNVEIARLNLTVTCGNAPVLCRIDGPESVSTSSVFQYSAITSCGSPTSYSWYVSPSTYSMTGNGTGTVNITFNSSGSYTVTAVVSNAYGSDQENKYVQCLYKSPFIFYPNPVNDILFIDVDQQVMQDNYLAAGKSAGNFSCEIRLYNTTGVPALQTISGSSSIQLNVSNLPSGIYFMHLFDGVSTDPEIKQIVIKH